MHSGLEGEGLCCKGEVLCLEGQGLCLEGLGFIEGQGLYLEGQGLFGKMGFMPVWKLVVFRPTLRVHHAYM